MKKIILLVMVFAVFASCKKTKNEIKNTDTEDRVFRVTVSSDKNFNVYITQFRVAGSEIDTIKYAAFGGNLDVNQGFTPDVGDKVSVRVVTPTGSFLKVNIVYKGNYIGPGANITNDKGITSEFVYDIKN